MSTLSKLRKSRDTWKQKAVERGERIRSQRKEHRRLKHDRDQYKQRAQQAAKELAQARQHHRVPVCSKEEVVWLSLQLFLVAHLSFRGVSRALGVLGERLGLAKTPCPQTVINWVHRLSIARIQFGIAPTWLSPTATRYAAGSIWLIDTSIALGDGKILAVLAINTHHHLISTSAPTMAQVTCLAVGVAPSWTGETIATFLHRVIAVTGCPAAYLKDGGSDLDKAVRLLTERGLPSPCIEDISHVSANLLKHEYHQHPLFPTFLSACGAASKQFKQTVLACLAPPKVSTKGRFMNLHRLVTWAQHILAHSPQGRAPRDSVLAKLRTGLGKIPACKPFIRRFLRDAQGLLACQKLLKTQGMSQESYHACHALLGDLPPQSAVRSAFLAWADRQLAVAQSLGLEHTGMPVTSDAIESLFGLAKQHGTGDVKDANRIALRLPALCGELTREDVQQVLRISVKEQQRIIGPLPSLTKQRREVLPNPGRLEELHGQNSPSHLVLLPGDKNREITTINHALSMPYHNTTGPPIASEYHSDIELNSHADRACST